MQKHNTTHQLDIGLQIDELAGTQRTKEQVALMLVKKILTLGANAGLARQDLLGAVISASGKQAFSEQLEITTSTEADILLRDYCHLAGFDLYTHKESMVKNEMQNFVLRNYIQPQALRVVL